MFLESDIKSEIGKILSSYGIKEKPQKSVDDYLLNYFTFCFRTITAKPRKVFCSKELLPKISTHPKANEIYKIIYHLKTGQSVIPFLSDKILQTNFHDRMINEWEIYHFHLSLKKEGKSSIFYKRSNALLFAYIDNSSAYLLDVDTHRDYIFAEKKWLRIIKNNWPNISNQWLDKTMKNISPNLDSKDLTIIREKGYSVGMVEIDGEVFHNPGVGSMVSGHSMLVMGHFNEFIRWIHSIEVEYLVRETEIKQDISKQSGIPINDLRISMKLTDEGFKVIELKTHTVIAEFN